MAQPMSPQAYCEEMNKKLDVQYTHGVHETGKRVTERLIAHFVKPTKDAECNTASMRQLTTQLEAQAKEIKQLEDQIQDREDEFNKLLIKNAELDESYQKAMYTMKQMRQECSRMAAENEEVLNAKHKWDDL